jgi:hypothetical protein
MVDALKSRRVGLKTQYWCRQHSTVSRFERPILQSDLCGLECYGKSMDRDC